MPYPQNLKGKTFSGARSIFLINGSPIGFSKSASWSEEIDYEPVDVLGVLEVAEFVPVAYRVTLSAQMFRLVGESIKKNGIMPRLDDILTSGEMEAAIQDIVSSNTVQLFVGVKCSGQSANSDARGIVLMDVTFVAVRTLSEEETI